MEFRAAVLEDFPGQGAVSLNDEAGKGSEFAGEDGEQVVTKRA